MVNFTIALTKLHKYSQLHQLGLWAGKKQIGLVPSHELLTHEERAPYTDKSVQREIQDQTV